jgi:hypothetical protein
MKKWLVGTNASSARIGCGRKTAFKIDAFRHLRQDARLPGIFPCGIN